MGWVNLAMLKILQVTLGLDETGALWALLALLIFTASTRRSPACGACW
jgi:hypothetical protein